MPYSDCQNWRLGESHKWMDFNVQLSMIFRQIITKIMHDGKILSSDGFRLSLNDGLGLGGSNFSKSDYLHYYERQEKKPMKILVNDR